MSVVSGALGAKASEHASEDQAESAAAANKTQWDMYTQSREDQLPWLTAGTKALGDLEGEIAKGPGDFQKSDYYQQGLAEEEKAIDRYLNSRGLYASGKAGKDLMKNAVSNMNKNRGNWLNEWIATKLNPTQSLAGVGQSTARGLGAEGQQTGYRIGTNLMNAGNAMAAGEIGQANAFTGASQNAANIISTYYGNKSGAAAASGSSTGASDWVGTGKDSQAVDGW